MQHPIVQWEWDFGDGTTFSGKNPPPHTYQNPGTYTVTLTVTANDGTGTATGVITVTASEVGGAQTYSQSDGNSGNTDDPISTATGEFFYGVTDLFISGPLPLSFDRYYASLLTADGYVESALGNNWMHNFDLTLITNGNEATVVYYHGKIIEFEKNGSNWNLKNPEPTIFQFVESGSYYKLMDPSINLIFTFDSSGKLIQIEDRSGNSHTLSYNGDNLSQVSDGLGRTLGFTYTSGHLTEVQDQGGRSIFFSYNGNDLTGFTDALGNTSTYSYTQAGGLVGLMISETLPEGNTRCTQTFDSEGRVDTQTDGEGNTTSIAFDTPSQGMTTVTDPLLNTIKHTHTNMKNLTQHEDQDGNTVSLSYDSNNRRSSFTDRLSEETSFTYHEGSGKIASITNANGDSLSYTYTTQDQIFSNPNGGADVTFTFYNLTRLDYPDGTNEQFTYDANGNMVTCKDRNSKTWQYAYNSRGQTTKLTNPTGGETTYTYNSDGNMASGKDSDTGTATYEYDKYKRITKINYPDGNFTSIAYNLNDQVTSVTDENGEAVAFMYDSNGNLIKVTDPASKDMQYTLDDMDRISQVIDKLGKISSFGYNAMGRLASITDPNGNTIRYSYDNRGWLTQLVDGEGKVWGWTYDDEHTLKTTVSPLGRTTTFNYNQMGWFTEIIDPLGNSGYTTYDTHGRMTSMIDRMGRQTTYAYDKIGLLKSISKPVIGTASYTRNGSGFLTQLTDFRGNNWSYSYTPMGRLASYTDPVGNVWTYTYNSRGLLSQLIYPTGEILNKAYDAADNDTGWHYSDGTNLQFAYDSLDRLTEANGIKITYSDRGEIVNTENPPVSFGATYDDGERLKTVTYNSGQFTVTYTYDKRDLVTKVEDDLTSNWVTFQYNNDGEVTQVNRSNGVKTTYTRDGNGRTTRILTQGRNSITLADQQLTLNAEGESTSLTQTLPLDPESLLSLSAETLSYDNASEISSGGYSYDARGRLTASPAHTFTWDGANRLTGVDSMTLAYNGLSDLVSMTENGKTTHYYYNYALALTPIVAEKDETTGQFNRFYVWTPGGTLLYGIDMQSSNGTFFYHFDRMGSTLFLTDALGNITDSYAYSPYGRLLGHNGSKDQPFTFIGRYGVRQLTGAIYHMGRRFYDSQSGSFLSRDERGVNVYDASSLNLYQYANQDPVNIIDPQGTNGWNTDGTVYHGKTGDFVQTQKPEGDFLGGWKWVPHKKEKDNPPAPDPQPPNKEKKEADRNPPEQPQGNPCDTGEKIREKEKAATAGKAPEAKKAPAPPAPLPPPSTVPHNTASETGGPRKGGRKAPEPKNTGKITPAVVGEALFVAGGTQVPGTNAMGAAQAAAETLVVVIKVDEADRKILGREAPTYRPHGRGRGGLREEASVAGSWVSGFFEGLAHPIEGWGRIFNGTAGR